MTISCPINASPLSVVIPLKDAKEDVSAIETIVESAEIFSVIWVTIVSGWTFLISTWFTAEWWAWLFWFTSNLFPVNNDPLTTESPLTRVFVTTVLVLLPEPYWTKVSLLVNFSPWTSVKNKVSNVAPIAVTTILNPWPLNTWALLLSIVNISPTW